MKRLFLAGGLVLCLGSYVHAVSLTGYYKLDDASLSTASATVGTSGTYNAGFSASDLGQTGSPGDPSGNSVLFPSAGEQLIAIPSAGGITDGNTFSITMWTQFANSSHDHTLASNDVFGGNANLLWWRDDADTATNTLAGMVEGDPRANGNSNVLDDTSWHLVALTYDAGGTNEQVFVDGQNITGNAPGADGPLSNATINLGNTATLAADKQFEGLLDEAAFWDRALTNGEMDALYFLSGAEEQFVTDAQGAATLFDFFEDGTTGDVLDFDTPLGFQIVDDVTAFGGTADQSMLVGDQLVLGLVGAAGLVSVVTPEPASIALWSLLGLIGLAYARRRGKV